ncbi:flagellar hook-associated protein FlgK [Beijerinckia sp. L45]|uniref:flagellar hook-associated protein FlgK n=1 Tax=Beijerinckia sp. L45 TaxID=1641855 RepID=UPI00131A6288|nr:flagellar hook-associated protein FlgK [Beijerinckia sp. L45]
MGLSATSSIAQSALASAAAQSSILSSNIANVSTAGYSRKSANIVTALNGSSTVVSIQRATNTALLGNMLQATSSSAAQSAVSDGLTQIQDTLGLNGTTATATSAATPSDNSPSTLIASLTDALQAYASAPDTVANGTAAVNAASTLTAALNSASAAVQNVRLQADGSIASSVQTINNLLTQFQAVNQQIVAGTASGADISGAQDTRDSILTQLSTQIGITTAATSNGGTSIATDSGVTLFDGVARQLSFTPTTAFASGTTGNDVSVDGVAITGSSAVMAISSGALAGLTTLRDSTAPSYQNQLDQIAGSLISTFAETSASGSPAQLAGLFTDGGSITLPTTTTGLAASISVAASVDPSQGGTATLLRDGNISGGSTTANTTGDAAFSGNLDQLVAALGATQTFDSTSGGVGTGTLATYASSSVGWIESSYQTATNAASLQSSLVSTATSALSNSTGVNLDDQMSQMLDIEHAYQASAQLLNTVGTMYTSLITAMN